MRAWPFPYMKLMHPFALGSVVTFYAFWKIQDTLCESKYFVYEEPTKDAHMNANRLNFNIGEQYANDPKNPKYNEIQARKRKAEGGH
ncbi:hypothetical protein GGH17_000917 [Coemansia sp. RSA 788]|nr:hypothetical protein GGH17_000917 [Coemansia sp. RSA 788]